MASVREKIVQGIDESTKAVIEDLAQRARGGDEQSKDVLFKIVGRSTGVALFVIRKEEIAKISKDKSLNWSIAHEAVFRHKAVADRLLESKSKLLEIHDSMMASVMDIIDIKWGVKRQ